MNKKSFLLFLVRQYFTIYTGSMVGTVVYCTIFAPSAEFSLNFLLGMFFFALCATLPSLVFFSEKELTQKQWMGRKVIHFLLLETVLLTLAKVMCLYDNGRTAVGFFFIVLGVYAFVWVIQLWADKREAEDLNAKLRERRNRMKKE